MLEPGLGVKLGVAERRDQRVDAVALVPEGLGGRDVLGHGKQITDKKLSHCELLGTGASFISDRLRCYLPPPPWRARERGLCWVTHIIRYARAGRCSGAVSVCVCVCGSWLV